VLSELYSNALEHGVLGLDSALKRDAAGFARYYQERGERLSHLESGFIRVHLQVVSADQGGQSGRLTIRVEDSGDGFDVQRVLALPPVVNELSGRGLRLVRELSEQSRWSEDGRTACVEFFWGALA